MTIKHYLLLILAVSAVAFMPALVWLVGALTLVGGAVGFIFSDLPREKQEVWELMLARTLQRMTTFLKKPVRPGANASGVTVDMPATSSYPVSPHPVPPYPPHPTSPLHHNLAVAIPSQEWPGRPTFDASHSVAPQSAAPIPPAATVPGSSTTGVESVERRSRTHTRSASEATLDTAYPETDLARRRLRPAPPLTPPSTPTKRR